MNKKELKQLSNENVICEFVYSSIYLGRTNKICKCDLKRFDNVCEEIHKRNILPKLYTNEIKEFIMQG